ncbi:hypothetical protein KUF71_006102 [Frankliniella fusca]|uniref:DUF4773 domain-containing protein n=1 Tax=Frankliniella fusca TaxID=407009 RepID=A0AAE1LEY2_9NEOP|nr:hypothetical protein KUF71_006102 [Frankliniella fusca]
MESICSLVRAKGRAIRESPSVGGGVVLPVPGENPGRVQQQQQQQQQQQEQQQQQQQQQQQVRGGLSCPRCDRLRLRLLFICHRGPGAAARARARARARAAGVVARALPGSLALDEVPGDRFQGVQADGLQDFEAEGDGETIDLLVPPMIWGLPDPAPHSQALKFKMGPLQRISLGSLPSMLPHFNTSCSCAHWTCACCARVEITPLRKNKTGCASLSYVREKIAVVLRLSLNNRSLIERELISGSNPPPFCFPIPQLPVVLVCLRVSNISLTDDAKIQACAAVEIGFVFTSPLIRLRFGCLKIGPGGISWAGTPSAQSFNFPAVDDTQTTMQQFAAALNSTDNEQYLLLQSILRQEGRRNTAESTTRSRKIRFPLIHRRNNSN